MKNIHATHSYKNIQYKLSKMSSWFGFFFGSTKPQTKVTVDSKVSEKMKDNSSNENICYHLGNWKSICYIFYSELPNIHEANYFRDNTTIQDVSYFCDAVEKVTGHVNSITDTISHFYEDTPLVIKYWSSVVHERNATDEQKRKIWYLFNAITTEKNLNNMTKSNKSIHVNE